MRNYIENILHIQNKILLEKIADKKNLNNQEKQMFVEKYLKINYHKVKIVKNNKLLNDYKNKLTNINLL